MSSQPASLHSRSNASKVVLITGAAKRMGLGIALYFAKQGWDIALHYHHSKPEADEAVARIQALDQQAIAIQADLRHQDQTQRLLDQCAQRLGEATCVINNASMFDYDNATSFSYEKLNQHMQANLAAPIVIARELHRRLSAQQLNGIVINLLDQKLYNYNPDFLSYTLSKAALQAATTMLAQALAPVVRIVGLAPGITLASGDQTESEFKAAHQVTPLGHSSSLEDIASAAYFLASSNAITGTTLVVDGGQHLLASERDVMFKVRS